LTNESVALNQRPTGRIVEEYYMAHPYWSDWYFGWGWFLWFGIVFLLFSSVRHWGYSYRAHQRFGRLSGKDALDILNVR
jgi:putative membrane protein